MEGARPCAPQSRRHGTPVGSRIRFTPPEE